MPRYLIQGSYTSEGAKGLLSEGGTGRRDSIEALMESVGGKLEAFYFAFGEDDAVLIVEAPSNVDVAAVALSVAATGSVGIKTTVLLTPEEIDEAAKKSVSYTPPGS
jgi:uncharacterized protein with GYD domain